MFSRLFFDVSFCFSSIRREKLIDGRLAFGQGSFIDFFPIEIFFHFYLRKKRRLDTLVGALCCVGRGFGCSGRAGPGWARIWLCYVRWAGLGGRFGRAGRVGLGWAWGLLWWVRWIWLSVYGLHCTCLPHVFTLSLCLSSRVSQMSVMGLEQNKAWHW